MRPQAGFALSLLAACGIHAILLFAPRAALVVDVHSPTVELELADAAGMPGAPAARPASPRALVPHHVDTAPAAAAAAPPPTTPAAAAPAPTTPAAATPAAATGGQADVASPEAPTATSGAGTGEGSGSDAAGNGGSTSSTGGASGSTQGEAASVAVPAMVPPRPLAEVRPNYPLSARLAGFEGVVKVIVFVDEKGQVTTVRILASSGHSSLDQAVLDAYKAARYTPALQHGRPVAGTDVWSYRFKLTE